jgi:ankyrin repeat protein
MLTLGKTFMKNKPLDRLLKTIQQGNAEEVKRLLTQTGIHKVLNTKNQSFLGETALMKAASMGYKEIVIALLASGADFFIRDNYNLHNAADLALNNGHQEIVEIIKEHELFKFSPGIMFNFFNKRIPKTLVEIMLDYLKPDSHLSPKK